MATPVADVPGFSVDWYRTITDLAHASPEWVRTLAGVATEAVVIVLGLFVLADLWRNRRATPRAKAFAVAAPALTVFAYGISEFAKLVAEQDRPCRAVRGIAATISECPALGDFSLPSNHTTIATAAAVGLAISWRRITALVLPLAPLEAFLRVYVGVHYPHDVLVGLVLGTTVVAFGTAVLHLLLVRRAVVVPHAGPAPTKPAS